MNLVFNLLLNVHASVVSHYSLLKNLILAIIIPLSIIETILKHIFLLYQNNLNYLSLLVTVDVVLSIVFYSAFTSTWLLQLSSTQTPSPNLKLLFVFDKHKLLFVLNLCKIIFCVLLSILVANAIVSTLVLTNILPAQFTLLFLPVQVFIAVFVYVRLSFLLPASISHLPLTINLAWQASKQYSSLLFVSISFSILVFVPLMFLSAFLLSSLSIHLKLLDSLSFSLITQLINNFIAFSLITINSTIIFLVFQKYVSSQPNTNNTTQH